MSAVLGTLQNKQWCWAVMPYPRESFVFKIMIKGGCVNRYYSSRLVADGRVVSKY